MIYAEVIGDPIAHSKSPIIHRHWLEALGIDADYRAHHVVAGGLGDYFRARADDPDWRGCNITLPHKIAALDHVGDPGNVRTSIGAINTVARLDGRTMAGTNTDAGGFFAPLITVPLAGAAVAVAGTGGAAHAVLFALARAGVGPVTLLARSPLKGAALLARFGLKGQVIALGAPLPPVALLVNATALGMTGQAAFVPDLARLLADAIVYDLVYTPLETPLLAAAAARGLATIDGLDMLIGQAALAFELFFGAVPPRDDNDATLRARLGS